MELGMPSRILTLPWDGLAGSPSMLPNFESLARRYRFRAMGEYCHRLRISSLLLAHHADDQAETILMRLAKGARGMGLLGIKPCSPIPECEGMYGVHESGIPIKLAKAPVIINKLPGYFSLDLGKSAESSQSPEPVDRSQLRVESGGVTIYRPLLGFSKERLIATCKALGMEWFEDDTNIDPTVTERNAIRHLYSHTGLSQIVPKSRLLSLTAKLQKTEDLRQQKVDQYIRKCKVISLDTRRGTLLVSFPFITIDDEGLLVAAMLLRRVLMIVTPNPTVTLDQAANVAARIYSSHDQTKPKSFNASGVMFQPLQDLDETRGRYIWHIFREPMYKRRSPMYPYEVPVRTGNSNMMPHHFLFDHRFWISIDNRMPRVDGVLIVRFLDRYDVSKLPGALGLGEESSHILRRLLRAVGGDPRWRYSLPLVVWKPHVGEEKVVGFPSLGVKARSFLLVKWKCRYRKINLSDLNLGEAVPPHSLKLRRVMEGKGEVKQKANFAPWLAKREEKLLERETR